MEILTFSLRVPPKEPGIVVKWGGKQTEDARDNSANIRIMSREQSMSIEGGALSELLHATVERQKLQRQRENYRATNSKELTKQSRATFIPILFHIVQTESKLCSDVVRWR